MGALGHYLEKEGLATTQISLVREHTEITKPPRALWVPFDLGRPFGTPGDAPFQIRVVLGALSLLEAPEGPILADFPDDAPGSGAAAEHLFCPISFAPALGGMASTDRMLEEFRQEAAHMKVWYHLALESRERTTAGISGLGLDEIVEFFAAFIGGTLKTPPLKEVGVATALRMAAEDLKAVYFESVAAQPGQSGSSAAIADWFWGETRAAQVINRTREICLGMPDNDFQLLGKLLLVPRTQLHRFQS